MAVGNSKREQATLIGHSLLQLGFRAAHALPRSLGSGTMGSRLLLAGNVMALLTTFAAFLQLLSWPDAGLLIIVSLMVTILLHANSKKVQASIPTVLRTVTPPQLRHEHHASPVQAQASETVLQPKTAPTPPKQPSANPATPKPAPAQPQVQTKPAESSGQTPSVIEKGDYLSLDVELDAGKELVGEVSADGIVNVYVLTEENLTSIDAGEEFWSETAEEGVEEATVRFTPSEKGTWFLVVENADDKDVSATVSVKVNRSPQKLNADRL